MGIRSALNQKTWPSIALAIGLLVVAAGFGYAFNSSGIPAPPTQAYFSADDGKTFFADSLDKAAPFDHGGAIAVRANVFQTANGTRFVAYLERLNEKARARVLELQSVSKDQQNVNEISLAWNKGLEVKRPGETKWVPVNSREAAAIMTPKAPDGGTQFSIVFP